MKARQVQRRERHDPRCPVTKAAPEGGLGRERKLRSGITFQPRITKHGGNRARADGLFEKNVRALIRDDGEIVAVIMPLLQAREMARRKCAALDHRLIRSVQGDATYRMLMSMRGVGPITAVARNLMN